MRRIGLAAALAMLLAIVGAGVVASAAHAGTAVGSFEIDGNTPDSPAGEPTDWDAKPAAQNPALTVTPFTDASGKGDDSFGMGSKQEEPGGWACVTGSSPQKGDITAGKIAFRTIAGKQYVYVNFTRKASEGSADLDYEFNQSAEPNPSCPALPRRTPGDILLAFDAENGGARIHVRAFAWTGNASLGTFVPLATGSQGVTWDGATNGDGTNKTGTFGEAVLNLTDTIGEVTCGEFSSVFMKSRSSVEINSALQDRTSKKPVATGACPNSTTTKTVRNFTTNSAGLFGSSTDAKPGDTIEYKLAYHNAGPGAAHGVKITDTIAAGTSYVPGSCAGCTLSADGRTLSWDLGTVAAGTTVNLTFKVVLSGTFAAGTATPVRNVATTTTAEEGAKPSTETTVNVKTPKSQLVKSVRNATTNPTGAYAQTANATPGNTIEYRLVYTNLGPGSATGVTISDPIPANSTFVSCSDSCSTSGTPVGSVTWNLGSFGAGSTKAVTFRVQLGTTFSAPSTLVKNIGTADTNEEPPTDSNETTVDVAGAASSSLAKSVRNLTTNPAGSFTPTATAKPGDTIQYQIVYTNGGPGTATNVVVSDPIPANSGYVSCTGGCTTNGPPVSIVTWNLGSVAPGTRTLTFTVKLGDSFPAGSTAVKNVATVTATAESPPPSNEVVVTVTARPDSTVAKSVRNATTNPAGSFNATATAKPGDTIEYRIVYANEGDAPATNVVVSDPIPASSTFVSCTESCTTNGPPVTTVTWNIGTAAAGTSKTLTFKVKLADTFPAGTTDVKNVATVTSTGESTDTSNEVVVTVTAAPKSAVVKTVRNATTNPTGSYTAGASAKPGDTIEYQIVYTNSGNANASNVVVSDPIPASSTYVSCTAGCTTDGPPVTKVTWDLGTVAPGATRTLTFKVKLADVFPAGTTQVKNVAVVTATGENPPTPPEVVVTVTATSNLTLDKAADQTKVVGGDSIRYTLTYGNTGNGTATGTTIVETVPAGTQFASCTGGCTVSGSTVTWSIGSVAPGGGGSVTLTVTVSGAIDECSICNVAQIKSPVQNGGTAVNSNSVCVAASPAPDASTAKAGGEAVGLKAYVPLLSIPLVNTEISKAGSSRTGPGQAADDEELLDLDILGVVGLTSVAKASVLRSTSSSQVATSTGARQTSTSTVLGLNVLNGLVTADVVRSVASTTATGSASSFSAAGTTFTNLKVSGSSVANATPGTRIALPSLTFGRGAYVAINEQNGTTSGPASGQTSGGTYKADLTVTAIRVYVTGGLVGGLLTLGGPPAEITVAKATAHSEHKQTRLCPGATRTQAVSGHAFVASAQVDPLLPVSTVGFVQIPASGGSAHKGVTATVLPTDGSVVSTTDAAADTTGTNGPTSSTASSYAQAAGACVLRVAASSCLIRATLIRSQANSSASAAARSSNASGTQFVDLVVAGVPISGTPPPNTTITLPLGLGFVVLNEQVPDGPETGHTGLTVRAIRVVVTLPLAPLLRGAEVIVAEAHSDATFR